VALKFFGGLDKSRMTLGIEERSVSFISYVCIENSTLADAVSVFAQPQNRQQHDLFELPEALRARHLNYIVI